MANRDLASECHPERLRYVGEKCKACYFRDYRAKDVSKIRELRRSQEHIVLTKALIAEALEKYKVRYNSLKKLGKLQPLDEGNGERAREIWAELEEIYAKVEDQLPTPTTEKA